MRLNRSAMPFVLILLAILTIGVGIGKFIFHILFPIFDAAPYILLNLMLSTLAGLQGAVLLIAAKRQDEISAALAQHDYETNLEAKAEIEELQMTIARLENEKHEEILAAIKAK